MAPSDHPVTFSDVLAAAERIRGLVHRTPLATCSTLDRLAGRKLVFKCEHLQRTGSFKYRGATNAVRSLDDATAARGVVTHSSGNHAQALALAAHVRGIPAHVVMPRTAAAVKKAAVADYGGIVVECEPNAESREGTAAQIAAQTGGTLIPPYDHLDIITGQGTAALELLEDCPDLDAVVAPVGGGGLLSGTCIAAKGKKPGIRVYGAEPLGADDAARSKAAGEWMPQLAPNTIADGLLTSLGKLTWPIVRDQVDGVFTASEGEIRAALKLVIERAKWVIEPSAAVGVAVVLSQVFRDLPDLRRVGVILCGGNVALELAKG